MTFRFDNLILSPVRKFHNHSQKSSGIPGTSICAEIVSPLFFFTPFVIQVILNYNLG